jgi:hypothetical protein
MTASEPKIESNVDKCSCQDLSSPTKSHAGIGVSGLSSRRSRSRSRFGQLNGSERCRVG